jgi:hypothetical protein
MALLESHVYPSLDKLPSTQRDELNRVLASAEYDYKRIAANVDGINYDAKKESLDEQMKTLQKSFQRDWEFGSERQACRDARPSLDKLK